MENKRKSNEVTYRITVDMGNKAEDFWINDLQDFLFFELAEMGKRVTIENDYTNYIIIGE